MRLFHKLFLLFSVATTAAALAMAMVLAWNLDRGFSEYLDARDAEMLDEFGAELESYLVESNPAGNEIPNGQAVARAVQQMANDGRIRELPPRPVGRPRSPEGPARNAGERPTRKGPPSPAFGKRLRILDAGGQLLFGPPRAPIQIDSKGASRDINIRGMIVASASLLPRGPTPRSIDTGFLRSQYTGVALVTALILLLSGLSAWVLARTGVKTLSAFQKATDEIANGNFAARVEMDGTNEIATLAGNVNSMAESLQALQSARRRWLAEISHELRTPLTVLRCELEALENGIRPIAMEAVQSLSEEAMKLNLLIDDLHLLAISDLGVVSTNFKQFDLVELLQKTVARSTSAAQEAGLELALDLGSLSALTVMWDYQRIEQLLGNLISNSFRYTDAPGQIRIGLFASAANIDIVVADSAPGVPPDQCKLLFEPLYRLEEARDRVSGGSGLGLSVAQAIVRAHGGAISAGPADLGGVAIHVSIPVDARKE